MPYEHRTDHAKGMELIEGEMGAVSSDWRSLLDQNVRIRVKGSGRYLYLDRKRGYVTTRDHEKVWDTEDPCLLFTFDPVDHSSMYRIRSRCDTKTSIHTRNRKHYLSTKAGGRERKEPEDDWEIFRISMNMSFYVLEFTVGCNLWVTEGPGRIMRLLPGHDPAEYGQFILESSSQPPSHDAEKFLHGNKCVKESDEWDGLCQARYFVIGLEERMTRRKQVWAAWKQIGMTSHVPLPTWIPAVKGSSMPASQWWPGKNMIDDYYNKSGVWGCFKSHLELMKRCVKEPNFGRPVAAGATGWRGTVNHQQNRYVDSPVNDVVIFEDDAIFVPDFPRAFARFVRSVPDDWDILYLGGAMWTPPFVNASSRGWMRISRMSNTVLSFPFNYHSVTCPVHNSKTGCADLHASIHLGTYDHPGEFPW